MNNRASTKEALLSTSIDLFIKHGFNQVTINQICKETNVTKTAFYYYYKSKDELISDFFSVDNLISNADLLEILSASDYANQVLKIMELYVKHIVRAGSEMTKEFYRVNLRKEVIISLVPDQSLLGNILSTLIQRAQEAGQVKNTAKATELHSSLCYIANGVCLIWAMSNNGFDVMEETKKNFENLLILA